MLGRNGCGKCGDRGKGSGVVQALRPGCRAGQDLKGVQLSRVLRDDFGFSQLLQWMSIGFEAGSYARPTDFVYHSTLGSRVTTRKKRFGFRVSGCLSGIGAGDAGVGGPGVNQQSIDWLGWLTGSPPHRLTVLTALS